MGQMTLYEHLEELRRRLIVCIIALLLATVAAWFLYNDVLTFIHHPYEVFLKAHPSKNISQGNLIITSPLEGFATRLKVSAYLGIVMASPVWLWELWRFITPGLYKHERRYAVPFIISAVGLFLMGCTASVLIFPKAISWLTRISGNDVAPLYSAAGYVKLYVLSCLIFGVAFLYPIVVVFLELTGVVPSAKWRKWRRVAIVVIFAVAAVITPSNDPFSFTAMALPLLVFYEASIVVGRILHK